MDNMYDVIISGGGPVGLALAIDLGQRGVRVVVIERHETPLRVPKGQNLTQRSMEHMARWGVEAEIRAAKTIPKGVGIGGLTAYGSLFSGYHYDWFRRDTVAPYYYTENERLPQYETEGVLRERVAELDSVEFRTGWTTGGIGQDGAGVRVDITDGERRESLSARYLVGCDGSRSNVRERSGISEIVQDHDRSMVLIVFESPEFFTMLKAFRDKQFYNVLHPDLDGYWMFFGLVEWGRSFFFHAPLPRGADRETFDFEGFIRRAVGRDFALELTYVGFWDLRISRVDRYRDGRVFVAGDAAHSHPPYGGYGINTGFEDARNLGWKLAARLQGWAGGKLLESYHEERAPVFASTADDFINRFITEDRAFLHDHDPDRDRAGFEAAWQGRASGGAEKGINTFAPHYAGSPVVVGGDRAASSAVGEHTFEALPGRHFPPQPMGDGTTTADHLSDGFTLFRFGGGDGDGVAPAFETAAKKLGIPLRVVNGPGDAAAAYGQALILVRPDDFIAWAGDSCPDPGAVLAAATGHESR